MKDFAKEFDTADRLYHYTTFETACKILASKKLLFGKICDVNDINESYRSFYYHSDMSEEQISKFEEEWVKYQQISFTEDKNNNVGFYIPAMWGHYAAKGHGVCLALNKAPVIQRCKDNGYKYSKITYSKSHTSDVCINDTDEPQTVFFNKKKEIFFEKTQDWSYELEFRIVGYGNEKIRLELSIEDCVLAVIVCYAKNQKKGELARKSPEYKILKSICTAHSIPVVELGLFFGECNLCGDFTWPISSPGEYTIDIENRPNQL